MPNNGQQFGSDYFTTTSIYMNDLMSNVREEYADRLEREQSYNEFLQQRIDGLDDTIRQYGVIRDTQEHREMGYYFQLAGLDDRQQRRVSSASRVALRATGNLVEDQRERFREGMSGEAGEDMALSRVLSPNMTMDDMQALLIQEINENPTMGRLLGDQFLSPEGGGGQGHIAAQIGAGLGISDALIRLNAASNTGFTDDQLRDVGARTVGLDSGAALSNQAAAAAQRSLSSQTLTQTANIPTISGIHAWLREQAPSWGVTEEMLRAEVELAGAQEQRSELRGELDARLQEQQGRDPDAEIESAFRDRLGPVGEGAQFSDTVLGAIQREHAGRRRRERTERIRNMSQSERILMGSVGEAREMALSFGNDAVREGASWDAARGLEVMARGNGIPGNEELVNLAAGMSNGDNNLRDEILRNYLYMRQIERNGTELNSSPEERERRLNDRLRDAVQRTGEDYRSNDAARISDAQAEVAQRNVHGPITSTGSDGWADYNLHENGLISYRHPEDNSLRRVPRGDPQYNRLLAITRGEQPSPVSTSTEEGTVEAGPISQESLERLLAEAWSDESQRDQRSLVKEVVLSHLPAGATLVDGQRGAPPTIRLPSGVDEAAGVGTELLANTLKDIQALEEELRLAQAVRGGPASQGHRRVDLIQQDIEALRRSQEGFVERGITHPSATMPEIAGRRRQQLRKIQSTRPDPSDYSTAAEYRIANQRWLNTSGSAADAARDALRDARAMRFSPPPDTTVDSALSKGMAMLRAEPSVSVKTAYDATEEALRDGAGR